MAESHTRSYEQLCPQNVDKPRTLCTPLGTVRTPRTSFYSKRGAIGSMSSMQCLGGGGSSSGAMVTRTSVPHTEHR